MKQQKYSVNENGLFTTGICSACLLNKSRVMETGIDFDDGARSSSFHEVEQWQNTKQSLSAQFKNLIEYSNSDNNTTLVQQTFHTSDIAKSLDHSPFTHKHNNK